MKSPYILILLCLFSLYSGSAQTMVIAHRGASMYAPENTLAAFELAISMGADYIETDVHQTADSVPVLMHDLSVNRTCCVPDSVSKKHGGHLLLIKDLSLLEFLGTKIKNQTFSPPTLDSAIKFIHGRCKLLIEIKKGSAYYPGIERRILEIIQQNKAEEWVNIIHSFDKKALLEVNKQHTGIRLQKLIAFRLPLNSLTYSRKLEKDDFENWQGVNVYYRFASRHLVHQLHKEHKTVYVWTVNRKRAARKLIKRGVDGIITNRPDMVKEILANK